MQILVFKDSGYFIIEQKSVKYIKLLFKVIKNLPPNLPITLSTKFNKMKFHRRTAVSLPMHEFGDLDKFKMKSNETLNDKTWLELSTTYVTLIVNKFSTVIHQLLNEARSGNFSHLANSRVETFLHFPLSFFLRFLLFIVTGRGYTRRCRSETRGSRWYSAHHWRLRISTKLCRRPRRPYSKVLSGFSASPF